MATENADGSARATDYSHTREAFLEHYNRLRDLVLKDEAYADTPSFAKDWLQKMLDYNVPGGKFNRGMAVLDVLKALKNGEVITNEDVRKANTLGWCIEWLQAFFLVADDIMDNSITRRGQPCWYRQEHVGLVAINDGIILESCIYSIIRKTFSHEMYYSELLDLFHETTTQTAHGQMLDVITAPVGQVKFDRYTVENYMRIIKFKTAFYSFYLPVACGLLLGGIKDPKAFHLAKGILIPMGQYFQIQDDYLDCFADPTLLGKIGTDIQDNKCSWLICQALQKANPEQKEKLEVNYGKDDAAAVESVKSVYRELELEKLFQTYEQESYDKLTEMINTQTMLPVGVFTGLLNKIYKRQR